MEERIYARGEFEEAKDALSNLRYEYRAMAQECSKSIKVCEVGNEALLFDDLGDPCSLIATTKKMEELKPQILNLQSKVKTLKDKWNF